MILPLLKSGLNSNGDFLGYPAPFFILIDDFHWCLLFILFPKKIELNSERLQFIVKNCTKYLNISSSLIKQLMKDNNKELLEILFKNHLNFFDNNLF